jgi:hypothetical protein
LKITGQHAVAQLVGALGYNPVGRGSMVSLKFFIGLIVPTAL